jgi:hypothetical protein
VSSLLQLARTFKTEHKIAGWYASEKVHGVRCFWDGGLSRDIPICTVPWANLAVKHRLVATGLWTRYGDVIVAPDWFLNQLPPFPLDGVLHCVPGARSWRGVEYAVFDSPPLSTVFASRNITGPNYSKAIDEMEILAWIKKLDESRLTEYVFTPPDAKFEEVLVFLKENLESQGRIYLHRHTKLPNDETAARQQVARLLERAPRGLVLRNPRASYATRRTNNVLMVKHANTQIS